MERRNDTPGKCAKLPRDYLRMIEAVFNRNFARDLLGRGAKREHFVLHGDIYPDELVIAVSLKNPDTLRMITCYASVDYPPPQAKTESGGGVASSASDTVQLAVSQCVDAAASFFATFFEEQRPVEYDEEYRQNWTPVELDKAVRVFLRINRDNTELDARADEILEQAGETAKGRGKGPVH